MKKWHLVNFVYVLAGIAFIGAGCVYLQSVGTKNAQQNQPDLPSQNSVVRREGWEIPGLVHSGVSGKRRLFNMTNTTSNRLEIEDLAGLYITDLKPLQSGDVVVPEDFFSAEEHQALNIKPEYGLKIRQIRQYDIDGRTFCYVVEVNPAKVGKDNRTVSTIPAISSLYFYDNDGDGKFETAQWGRLFGFGLHAPEWVLRK